MFEILRKHLQGGQVVWPVVLATIIATIFTVLANYVSMYVWKFGFYGIASISAISQWVVSLSHIV